MRRQMMERETIWKDEAPPSTAMRNKKNIKRKKKLNTPKPSVFALFCEVRGRGLSAKSPPLSATAQSSFIFCAPQSKMLPSLQMSWKPLPTELLDMALRLAAWWGAATHRYRVWSRKHTSGWCRAQSTTQTALARSLSSPCNREERDGVGWETDRQRGREREMCGGGSLCWIVNWRDATVKRGCCNNCQESSLYKESNGSLCCPALID